MKRFMVYTVLILLIGASSCHSGITEFVDTDQELSIFPDYRDVTVPYNIAPLNFKTLLDFEVYKIEVQGEDGSHIRMKTRGKVIFNTRRWKNLLERNKNAALTLTIYGKKDGIWMRFEPFSIFVSQFPIDTHLAYRLVAPGYEAWSKMGIYQRNLTNYDENALVNNTLFVGGCMNCHSFRKNDPSHMMFHLRGQGGGTILNIDSVPLKLNTKTEETMSNFQYPYWHPSGRYIAYSVNKTAQVFHSHDPNRIEVFDSNSDVVVYDIERNTILTSKELSHPDWFETWPTFSPEGDYLYFTTTEARPMPESFDQMKYSLCRIAFDPTTGTLGEKVDTLVNSSDTGMSSSFPRISPDGRFLMYTQFDYGNFPIWHKSANLYLMDLSTGEIREMNEVNSNDVDSYHSWSSNSRWFVFSSRRINGLYTMPFIAFINEKGKAGKPFLLPQKNPDHYNHLLFSYNIPELIKGPVKMDRAILEKEVRGAGTNVTFMQID